MNCRNVRAEEVKSRREIPPTYIPPLGCPYHYYTFPYLYFRFACLSKIINALLLSELCACDIAAIMRMSQPAVAHHLKILRQTRLVKCRKVGKVVYYSLCDGHVGMLFDQCQTHVREE